MKDLADILKEERLRQGLTLEAVSKRVRISVKMLQYMEEGQFDQIGTALLIRGFVRSYCSALGMDPAPLLERFGMQIQACDRQEEGIRRYGIWSRSFHSKSRVGFFAVLVALILIAGAIYGGNMIAERKARLAASPSAAKAVYPQQELPSDLPGRNSPEAEKTAQADAARQAPSGPSEGKTDKVPQGTAGKPVEPAASRPVPAASMPRPGEVLPEERTASAAQPSQKNRLTAVASRKAWIEVKPDGKPPQQLMMQKGETREWEVEKEVRVALGRSGSISLTWNGTDVKPPATSKKGVRLRLPDPKLVPEPGRTPAQ